MQGRLTQDELEVIVETECAHCSRPLRIELDDRMRQVSVPPGATPLVSIPVVDIARSKDPSIIHDF